MPIGVLSSYNILPIILKSLVITLELFLGFSDFYYKYVFAVQGYCIEIHSCMIQ